MGSRRSWSGERCDRMNVRRERGTVLRRLRQQLHYNTVCAPDYPREDGTSIDREVKEILDALAVLGTFSNSDSRRLLLDSATRNAKAAFAHYQADNTDEGRGLLESVLEDLLYYEADKLPETSFIVDPAGGVSRSPKSGH